MKVTELIKSKKNTDCLLQCMSLSPIIANIIFDAIKYINQQ